MLSSGELHFFDNSPRAASARANSDAIRSAISKTDFDRRLDNTDPIIKSMIQFIMDRVRSISDEA